MHVHTPDQHLAPPPLGAGDQLVVPWRLGELLRGPAGEWMRAGAEQLHAHRLHDGSHSGECRLQVSHGFVDGRADTGDDLDGVTQQLLVDVRVVANRSQHRRGPVSEVPSLRVNESELPLHPQSGPRRPAVFNHAGPVTGMRRTSRRMSTGSG